MRRFIYKLTGILAITFLFGLQLMAQPDVGQFFNNLKNKVIADAEKLAGWKSDAESAAKKTVKDFTDCPSPAAQQLYNDLKNKLEKAKEVKKTADEAERQSLNALENCKRTTRLVAQCNTAYNSLPFKATSTAANVAIATLEAAIKTLSELRCPSGCNKTGRIIYPTIQFGVQNISATDSIRNSVSPIAGILPLTNEITYCSSWRRGSFWANWDAGNGEFDADFHLRMPKCEKTSTIPVCTQWDLNLLLPKLQKLNIVPPNISVSDLKVEVPNKNVSVVSGVKQVSCNKPIRVPKRLSVTLNLELSSNPLDFITTQGQEMVEIGCAEPAFGLEPITNTVSVPDVAHTRISWNGITVKGGYIEIDMTKPELQVACKKGIPSTIKVPTVNIGKGSMDLPYVCLQPRFIDVVANK